jgi:hypothetical protein
MEGWIKFHRKFIKWEWFKRPHMFHLFGYMLMMACHEDTPWNGIILKRGQLAVGRHSLSANTGISAQSVRTCITKLKSTNEITIKSTNQYSIITIINYDHYNYLPEKSTNESTNDLTNDQPTTNQRPTTYKKDKNDKNEEEEEKEDENYFEKINEETKIIEERREKEMEQFRNHLLKGEI